MIGDYIPSLSQGLSMAGLYNAASSQYSLAYGSSNVFALPQSSLGFSGTVTIQSATPMCEANEAWLDNELRRVSISL